MISNSNIHARKSYLGRRLKSLLTRFLTAPPRVTKRCAVAPICAMTRTLAVASEPTAGLDIQVSPLLTEQQR